jgi:hypothetical protein
MTPRRPGSVISAAITCACVTPAARTELWRVPSLILQGSSCNFLPVCVTDICPSSCSGHALLFGCSGGKIGGVSNQLLSTIRERPFALGQHGPHAADARAEPVEQGMHRFRLRQRLVDVAHRQQGRACEISWSCRSPFGLIQLATQSPRKHGSLRPILSPRPPAQVLEQPTVHTEMNPHARRRRYCVGVAHGSTLMAHAWAANAPPRRPAREQIVAGKITA